MASRLGPALNKNPLILAAACLAVYASTLGVTEFFHDDQILIADNPLLRLGWRAVPALFTTGYWEAAQGAAGTSVHYYRPVLMLTFWLQAMTTGFWAPAMHALNLILHVCVVLLLRLLLLKRLPAQAAEAAALFYALSPMHTEAVSSLTGRSEILAALCVLGAWMFFENGRFRAGLLIFFLGLLVKETVFLFPVFFALSDWVFHGRRPWDRERRALYSSMGLSVFALLAARAALLPKVVAGGVPYFDSRLTAALTVSRFALGHYLAPSLTGLGQCSAYARPLIADASLGEWSAWLSLAVVSLALGAGLWRALARRCSWGFWISGFALFLLPGSHLIFPLDTIGAERFLYLPLVGLSAAAGAAYQRLAARRPLMMRGLGLAGLLWFGAAAAARNQTYGSWRAYYEAAVDCNPVSAGSWSALGAALLRQGDRLNGEACLKRAVDLDESYPSARYNLARMSYENGDWEGAEKHVRKALAGAPRSADALVLAALIAERRGRLEEMRGRLEEALSFFPEHSLALYNLGRYWMMMRRQAKAEGYFERYLRKVPQDREAAVSLGRLAK